MDVGPQEVEAIPRLKFCLLLFLFTSSCVSKKLSDFIQPAQIKENEEYEKMVNIEELPVKEEKLVQETQQSDTNSKSTQNEKKKTISKSKIEKRKTPTQEKVKMTDKEKIDPSLHLPKIEDGEGFVARRPVKDPFRPGEKIVLALTYLGMDAGYLELSVRPFVEVNGEKAYKFFVGVKSSKLFSYVYSLDNSAETYVSYEQLIPFSHEVHLNESKQIKESRSFFDWPNLTAHYWEKRVTKEKGEEKRKIHWQIEPYAQNVISALFYMRAFAYKKGKKYAFRVADDNKNIVFRADVVKREKIKTDAGEFNTVVIQPRFEVDGSFAQTGKILFWLTDDDRKFLVKIKSKIKIGSIYGELMSIQKE